MLGKSYKFAAPAPFKDSQENFRDDANGRKITKKTFTYQDGTIVSVEFSESGNIILSSNRKLKFNPVLGTLKSEQ